MVAPTSPILEVPSLALVVLIGPSGSGKSTFAAQHFAATEVVSSDRCRALVADDENDQGATAEAFAVLHRIVAGRLRLGRFTVVDATNVEARARAELLALARTHHVAPVAVVFDLPLRLCLERREGRTDRGDLPAAVVERQHALLRSSAGRLRAEGFRRVTTFSDEGATSAVQVVRRPLWCDRRDETGPFDLVGDVHGCHDELMTLVGELGYPVDAAGVIGPHPDGRHLLLLGDLVDRGPAVPATLRTAMQLARDGIGTSVLGNHDDKLRRALDGHDVVVTNGLARSLEQLADEPPAFRDEVRTFLGTLVSHAVLDGGALVAAHAGLPEHLQGRSSAVERAVALTGHEPGDVVEGTGAPGDDHPDGSGPAADRPPEGTPVGSAGRHPAADRTPSWVAHYRGPALVVYGHTPVDTPRFERNTIGIDTGCVFGGALTALQYPERTLVSVAARRVHYRGVPERRR